jgi:co-chaperonin GroES (HSP10)
MDINVDKFTPHGKWVVVKADPRVKETKGGIVLPDMQLKAERVMEGTGRILKVGYDKKAILDACGEELKPDMRIFYRGFLKDAFAGFTVDEDGLAIFLLRAEDVMGVLEDDNIQMGAFS